MLGFRRRFGGGARHVPGRSKFRGSFDRGQEEGAGYYKEPNNL